MSNLSQSIVKPLTSKIAIAVLLASTAGCFPAAQSQIPLPSPLTPTSFTTWLIQEGASLFSRWDASPSPSTPTSFTTATIKPFSGNTASYIGWRYKDLPPDLKSMGGGLIGKDEIVEENQYAFNEVLKGKRRMVWLEKFVSRAPDGKVYWEVVDVLEVPEMSENEWLVWSNCKLNPETELWGSEMVAILKSEKDGKDLTQARKAWQANIARGKFEEISPNGVVCLNGRGPC